MEQITAIKITGITFTDFRNHKKPEHYSFGDISYITGHNGSGKTTMAHGVAYALYGVNYYGEQKIDRLMNETAAGTQVQLDFTDQNGKAHTLIRSRNGDKTALLLDSYTVRQADIDRMLCDKETFLSMFNPLYLTERLGEKGRALILKHLQPVSSETVLEQLEPGYREYLDGMDLNHAAPDALMKDYREAIRQTEMQVTVLQGHIESMTEAQKTAEEKLTALYREKSEAEAKMKALTDKQFAGMEREDLAIQRDMPLAKLSAESDAEDNGAALLRAKLEETRRKTYEPKYAKPQSENAAEIKALSGRYNALAERIKGLKSGTQCPTCFTHITEQNLPEVRNSMMAELKTMAAHGHELMDQGREIAELEAKSKAVFEQFQAEDIQKLTDELTRLEMQKDGAVKRSELRSALEQIEEMQKYGNLDENEYSTLTCMSAELTGIEAQIQAIEDMTDEQKLKNAYAEQDIYKEQILKYRNILNALSEFACKRTEIAVAGLQMPNVKIKLFDVMRSTGEVVGVFKFTYKDRDYATLSLSEKTLAGIEITAMLRKITGLDCPVCVDNTESIEAFHPVSMPSQTLLLRFVKGQPLTVQFRNHAEGLRGSVQELKKAG